MIASGVVWVVVERDRNGKIVFTSAEYSESKDADAAKRMMRPGAGNRFAVESRRK